MLRPAHWNRGENRPSLARFRARPDAGWKAVGSQEWLRYLAISWTHVIRER